jgi:group I intron endonuclease
MEAFMSVYKIACVYQITNIITGERYVGSSTNYARRRTQHRHDWKAHRLTNPNLQKAHDLYGKNALQFSIIELCPNHIETLRTKEEQWIKKLQPEYNISLNPTHPTLEAYVHNKDAHKKISETIKKQWADGKYDHKKGMHYKWKAGHNPRKGVKLTEEQKQHLSEINSGENNPNYGLHRSEETKMKQSLGHTKPNKYPGAISPDGTIYTPINNMSAFCREHDLTVSQMIALMHHRVKSHKGWTLYKDV